jgi:hypothetical protein
MTHLDRAMSENQNFIKNTTFGASFWNDEIGFRLRMFADKTEKTSNTMSLFMQEKLFMMIMGMVIVVILGWWWWIYIRRKPDSWSVNSSVSQMFSEHPTGTTLGMTSLPLSSHQDTISTGPTTSQMNPTQLIPWNTTNL